MEDIGWNTANPQGFDIVKNTVASGLRGTLFHDLVDSIMTYNKNNPDNQIQSFSDYINNKDIDTSGYTKLYEETVSKLARLGINEDYLGIEGRINSYLEAYLKSGMGALEFSERQLGLKFTDKTTGESYTFGLTPDQFYGMLDGTRGVVDTKTGAVKGLEGFQLTMEKLGMFMNGVDGFEDLSFQDLNKIPMYIAKVTDHGTELIEYADLSIKQLMQILKKAFAVAEGDATPFTHEEAKQFKTQLSAGRIYGGEPPQPKQPNTDKQFERMLKQYEAGQRRVDDKEIKAYTAQKKAADQTIKATTRNAYATEAQNLAQVIRLLEGQRVILTEINGQKVLYNQATGESVELTTEQLARFKQMEALLGAEKASKRSNVDAYVPSAQKGFLGSVFNEFKSSVAYLTKVSLIYGAIGKVKQAVSSLIQTAEKLDKALTNLQIVTRSTREDLQEAVRGYNNLADQLGVATDTVLQSAEDWLRAGYSIEESNKLITSSIKLATLGMMDAKEATTALISVMKGWKVPEEQLASIVDNVTALDSAFATTAGDITTAMAKANVSASLSGMSIKDFEAYITTVLDTSQLSAETVGTS